MVTTKERVVPRKSSTKKEREAGWAYLVPMPGVKYYVFTDDHKPVRRNLTKVAGKPATRRQKKG